MMLRNACGYLGPICVIFCITCSWMARWCLGADLSSEGQSSRTEIKRGRSRPIISCSICNESSRMANLQSSYYNKHQVPYHLCQCIISFAQVKFLPNSNNPLRQNLVLSLILLFKQVSILQLLHKFLQSSVNLQIFIVKVSPTKHLYMYIYMRQDLRKG